jgi:hypothetical protein
MTEKQNKRKAALIALLALSVIVTSTLIGTLAKYATSRTVSDNASAAKFGLNIPNTINLFADSYTNVESATPGKKVIAPGTFGQYDFSITGSSEVAYAVSANVTVTYSEEWGEYNPLEFSINGTTWTDLDQFKTDLSAALQSQILDPDEPYTNMQTIYWRWPFHTSAANDIKDTEMGVAAATGTAPKVTINIEATAAQVQ